jgi:CheY-like chemotaxis protein
VFGSRNQSEKTLQIDVYHLRFVSASLAWQHNNLATSNNYFKFELSERHRRHGGLSVGVRALKDRNAVLVVDDDPEILSGLEWLLWQHAYVPVLLSSAAAFKDIRIFEKVVCVILDINLKDGSGIELGHHLQAAAKFVPVIYMTGNQDAAVRAAALNSGCVAFLSKPFSTQALIEPLNKAAAGRS